MKRLIVQHKIAFCLSIIPAILIGALLVYEFAGKPIGFTLACFDQAVGNNRIKAIGGPTPSYEESYVKLLNERYKVKVDRVAYCAVSPWDVGYSQGYNSVSIPKIQQKFGNDVFSKCHREAVVSKLMNPKLPDDLRKSLMQTLCDLD